MVDYEAAMAMGSAGYRDAVDLLAAAGIPVTFTQTGGMCAALEARLEGRYTLLITDADDALPWDSSQRRGWGVGFYRPYNEHEDSPVAFGNTRDPSLAALLPLVRDVLAAGVQEEVRRAGGYTAGPIDRQPLAAAAADSPDGRHGASPRSETARRRTHPRGLPPPSIGR
jgi:hypothetical protein